MHGALFDGVLFVRGRMHQDIMTWPSQFLYEGVLMAHSSVAHHTLRCVAVVLILKVMVHLCLASGSVFAKVTVVFEGHKVDSHVQGV